MFIGHKANTIIGIGEVEWMCRSTCKRLYTPEYWTWVATITSGDPPVVDYSGETGYTIVECSDEDVQARLNQLGDYQSSSPETGTVYNIKWSDSKVKCEEVLDNDGISQTDYLALSDGTLTADMTAYREALRDVPEDNADVESITWPTKP